ncbi:MAG: hypothetical protein J7K34_08335 [Flavobacteriaceae bacterium]|nr:hypothetical protein [Flavobacteriaceae bacterium]
MKQITKILTFTLLFAILLNLVQCQTQNVQKAVPFTVIEKSYFNWAGGKKGDQGTTIKIVGNFDTTSLAFSSIYFQNHKYEVVPEIKGKTFILIGNRSSLKKDMNMSGNATEEYGNTPPNLDKEIPFDLQKDEAVIEYSISGQVFFHKVAGIKQLETVYYP